MDIEMILDRMGLDESRQYRPRYGHCREIAVALHDVFSGQLVALSQVPGVKQLDHVVVRVDGRTYDGCGRAPLAALLPQYVPDPDAPLDDYTFEVTRAEVVDHEGFDQGVYNEIHRRVDAMVSRADGE